MSEAMAEARSAPISEKKVTILEAITAALHDAMAEDGKVLVLGEDVGDAEGGGIVGVTRGLSGRFGELRVRSTPISEQAILGASVGAAMVGWKPVAEVMLMNFLTVGMDMIVNHAAKLRYMSGGQTSVPLVVRTMTGAGASTGGQHADYLEGWFAHTAGLKVVAPSTPADAYGLLRSAIDDPDPVIFIENLVSYGNKGPAPEPGYRVPLGKARVAAEGGDITIIGYSATVDRALAARALLAEKGISAEVIDLRTVAPWDKETVFASVAKTGRALVVHEAVQSFGPGGEIAATLASEFFGKLKAPVERLGAPFTPVPFAKSLETAFIPGAQRIAAAASALVQGK